MNDTPNAAELRAAEATADATVKAFNEMRDGNSSATLEDFKPVVLNAKALAIRRELHLEEVRERLSELVAMYRALAGEDPDPLAHWNLKRQEAEQALKRLNE